MITLSSPFIIIDEIETKLNELNNSLGTTIDTINENVNAVNENVAEVKSDVADVKSSIDEMTVNVAINNTASTTGTLSQKLSSVISTIVTINSNVNTLKGKSSCKIQAGSTTSSLSGPAFFCGQGYNDTNAKISWYGGNTTLSYSNLLFCPSGQTVTVNSGTIYYLKFSNN